jgi:pimeloyl-ACP methyl ester carboxylesterase
MYDLLGLLVASRFDAEADSVWLEGSIHNAGSDPTRPEAGGGGSLHPRFSWVPMTADSGAEDEWISPEMGADSHALIPHSQLQLVPAAGHFLQQDAPDAVASHSLDPATESSSPQFWDELSVPQADCLARSEALKARFFSW